MDYEIYFRGRIKEAIGKSQTRTVIVKDQPDKSKAIFKLYDKYEHIEVIEIKEHYESNTENQG